MATVKMPPVNCTYGAPMGRRDYHGDYSVQYKLKVFEVVLDSGGYDNGGAYWGHHKKLFCIESVETESTQYEKPVRHFIRAENRNKAKAEALDLYPNAKFFR